MEQLLVIFVPLLGCSYYMRRNQKGPILRARLSQCNSPLRGISPGSAPSVPLSIVPHRIQVEQGHRVVGEPSMYVTGQELKPGNRESNKNDANSFSLCLIVSSSPPLLSMYNNPTNNTRQSPYIVIRKYTYLP